MCVCHAGWIFINKEKPLRISYVPFLFLPLLMWVGLRVNFGAHSKFAASEWLFWLQLFIFFWILSNHGGLRAQTKLLSALAVGLLLQACFLPLWDSQLISGAASNLIQGSRMPVVASVQTHHLFASSDLWGAYIGLFVPAFCIAALLPRLESILRILYAFLVLFCVYVLASHHLFMAWATSLVFIGYFLYYFSEFSKALRKCVLAAAIGFAVFILSYAFFVENAGIADFKFIKSESIGMGTFLWGMGRGTWHVMLSDLSQLSAVFLTDAAFVWFQYGLTGLLLGLIPYLYVLRKGWLVCQSYPSLSSRGRGRKRLVKYERFCLLIVLSVAVVAIINFFCIFSLYQPTYGLLLILSFSLLAKLGFKKGVCLSDHLQLRRGYMVVFVLLALYLLRARA